MATEQLTFDIFAKASGAEDVKKLGRAIDDVGKSADDLDKKGSVGANLFTKMVAAAKDAGSKIGTALTSGLKSTSGGGLGSAFVAGFKGTGVEAAKALVDSFTKESDGRLKDAKGKIVKAGSDAAKGYAEAVAKVGDDDRGFFSKIVEKAGAAGADAGKKLGSGIVSGLEGLGPGGAYVGAAIVAAVVAASPLIAGAVSGALIAGVAAAGIGGAVALQLKENPELLRIFGDLGTQIKTQLTQATSVFAPQMVASAQIFRQTWNSSVNDVRQFFANLAGDGNLTQFAQKIADGVQKLTAGLSDLSVAFTPVLQALGTGLGDTLATLGTAFSDMGQQGAAAATALQLLFGALNGSLAGIFQTINGLTAAFGWLAEHGILGSEVQASYEAYKTKLDAAAISSTQLGSATQQTTSLIQEQANALKAQTDPIFALTNAQETLTQKQQAYNDAVKTHGKNSEEAKQASLDLAGASVTLQGAVANAAQAGFDGTLTPAMRRSMEAAGLTKDQIDAAERSLNAAYQAATKYQGTYTAHVVTIFEQIGKPSSQASLASNTYKGLAKGGIVSGGGKVVHAANGRMTAKIAAGGSDLIHWAEPETGGEAYIPRLGNTRRSRRIATTVVEDWLGGKVSWGTSRNGGSGDAGRQIGGGASSPGFDLAGVARSIEAAVERGLSRASFDFDGRRFAYVQGRESDLYERAG